MDSALLKAARSTFKFRRAQKEVPPFVPQNGGALRLDTGDRALSRSVCTRPRVHARTPHTSTHRGPFMSAPPTNPNGSAAAAAAAIAASLAPGGGNANTAKRRFADPEYIAISEFLSSVEVEDQDANHHHSHSNTGSSGNGANANGRGAVGDEGNQLARSGASSGQQKRARLAAAGGSAQPPAPRRAAPLAAGKAYQEGDSRELVVANKSRGASARVCRWYCLHSVSLMSTACVCARFSWKWCSEERWSRRASLVGPSRPCCGGVQWHARRAR